MLVLRRKIGEEVRIGENVIVKVLAVNGRAIRLGIEAPEYIPIWRAEWAPESVPANQPNKPEHLAAT